MWPLPCVPVFAFLLQPFNNAEPCRTKASGGLQSADPAVGQRQSTYFMCVMAWAKRIGVVATVTALGADT